jgi:hypothetical protein
MKISKNKDWYKVAGDDNAEDIIPRQINKLSRHLLIQHYIDTNKGGNRDMYLESNYYDHDLEIWIVKAILTRIGKEDLIEEIISFFSETD